MTRDELKKLAGQIAVAAGPATGTVSLHKLGRGRFVARVQDVEFIGALDEALEWAVEAARAAVWRDDPQALERSLSPENSRPGQTGS